jgi:hypothetical protein
VAHRIELMLDLRASGAGAITDRGDRELFTWQVTGTPQVWRQDGPKAWPVQLTGGDDAANVVGVAPDGSWVVVSRAGGLYVADAAGGPLRVIEPKAELAYITDDGKALVFGANPASSAIYRWENGEKTLVFDKPGSWHVVDHRGDVWLMTETLGPGHVEVFEYDLAKQALVPVLGQNESADYQVAFGAKPGQILVRTNKLGEYQRLYAFEAGKLTPITPGMDHDVATFRIDEARARIYYTVDVDGYERLYALDAKTLKRVELPLPEGENQRIAGLSHNGRFVQIELDGARLAPTVVTYDWKAKKLTTWRAPATPEIDATKFAPVTLESYPARDGTKIPMFVRRPTSCAEPCPVIVLEPGIATGGFDPYAQLYVDARFVVVAPRMRGSMDVADIEDLATYLHTAWAKDGRAPKLGIVGSLGTMTELAGSFDAGVVDHPGKTEGAHAVKAPLLLLQGARDPHVGEAMQLHDELVQRGVPCELIVFPEDGRRTNLVLQIANTIAFFEKHLTAK